MKVLLEKKKKITPIDVLGLIGALLWASAIFLLLFVSEVVHDKFLNSRFDFYDMIASLIALGVMILSYKYKK